MTEPRPGLAAQIRGFPTTFWVANTMEILERMSWYGWFVVMPLYVTGSKATGGLGFTTEDKGALQAIIPFLLYLFPVLTGALADRYGYKRMFVISYVLMIASYWGLGRFTTFPTFFLAFLFVAVAAAIFKPVVVGTVAKVTSESNSATGFGIFYMMVNIGGFVGPIVAGLVRGSGWDWVFIACSGWAAINLVLVLLFYREPVRPGDAKRTGSIRKVLDDAVEVLGNLRFFLAVFVVLLALMFANLRVGIFASFDWWPHCAVFVPAWLVANLAWDAVLRRRARSSPAIAATTHPLLVPMRCGNWRFALFLLLLSGFWTSFLQIFNTMPEYIRDFVETRPLIEAVGGSDGTGGIASTMATVNEKEREAIAARLESLRRVPRLDAGDLSAASRDLLASKVRIAPEELGRLVASGEPLDAVTDRVIASGRQVNPEFITNIDAAAIILFQVAVSYFMARFHRFTTMIVGMLVAAVGVSLPAIAGGMGMVGPGASAWVVCLGLAVLAFGEMMTSPTSQEYVGTIAPRDKKALYMGYYFVAIALGNLFAGILGGELYGRLARDLQRPDLMWLCFGAILLVTMGAFLAYHRFALPRSANGRGMPGDVVST